MTIWSENMEACRQASAGAVTEGSHLETTTLKQRELAGKGTAF